MLHGCIPLIIMDGVAVPFEQLIEWDAFALRIKEEVRAGVQACRSGVRVRARVCVVVARQPGRGAPPRCMAPVLCICVHHQAALWTHVPVYPVAAPIVHA